MKSQTRPNMAPSEQDQLETEGFSLVSVVYNGAKLALILKRGQTTPAWLLL